MLFLLHLLLLATITSAQSSYLVKHYTKQDYHAGSQNWSVDTDQDGNVYLGNNDGLLIFDGTHWTICRNPDQTIVRSVYVAPDKRIYTGSYEEFGYWERDETHELKYHSLKPLLQNIPFHNSEIWKIVQCNEKIYFQSFSSLFVYDHQTVKPIEIPGTVIFLLKARNRLFVQSLAGNLYEIVHDTLQKIEAGNILEGTEVKTILPFTGNSFLIGTTSSGLFIFDGKKITPWKSEANEMLKNCQINNGIISGERLFFGTIVKGLFILDMKGKIVNHLHNENALQNNTVLSLCADQNGSVWVGLDRGIDNLSQNALLEIYQEKGEQLGAVYTAALLENTLYVGTNRGIFTYTADPETGMFKYDGLLDKSQGQVWDLKKINGVLFCGHTAGTFIVEGKKLKSISRVSGGYSLKQFERDGNEYMIQSTYSPLVIYNRPGKEWQYLENVTGYLEPSRFLELDHLENIWIGHAVKGLYKLQLSDNLDSVTSCVRFGKKDGFPSDFNIRVFKVDNRVVFTSGTNLFTWDDLKSKMIYYSELNGQLQGFEAATKIADIGNNLYWFIKKNDAALFRIKENKADLLFHLFLPVYALNMVDDYENIVPLDQNRNLICLENGFAIFHTNLLKKQIPDRTKMLFRDVFSWESEGLKKRVVFDAAPFNIRHSRNNLSISFTCINSRNLIKLYQYKLNGIDNDWSEWTDNAEITYTRLPKGDYTFLVRSLDEKGMLTEPISLNFTVTAAWYASVVAYIIYILLILGITLWSRFIFRRRVIRHHEKLRLEDEARALLEKEHAEQEIIKLQNENLQSEISHKNIQLADSTMAIIKKNELLIEIKEELDKQRNRLGQEYPQRYFDRLLSLINKNISNDNDWQVFEELFDQAHENFFRRLKTAFPELTQSDLKLS
ncbi:MAG: triple tyrosine motif-containing protein [Bacteroidetes bacterium]|nr:triple tyrosine motif-containing protein [Bacteroidota bacterium]